MHSVALIALGLGLGLGLAACEGPSEPSTQTVTRSQDKAFAEALQPLCRDSQAFQRDVDLDFPRAPLDLKVGGQRLRTLIELEATNDVEYDKLRPPVRLAEAYRDFTENRAAIAKQRAAIATAMESGDADASKAEEAKFAKLNDQRRVATTKLNACTLDLTAAERREVVSQLTEFATSDDSAKVCSEVVLVSALPLFYEGPDYQADCRASIDQQAAKKALATGIKVDKVEGWKDIVATVTYADKGGEYDGLPARAKLYHVDGAWRVFSVS